MLCHIVMTLGGWSLLMIGCIPTVMRLIMRFCNFRTAESLPVPLYLRY